MPPLLIVLRPARHALLLLLLLPLSGCTGLKGLPCWAVACISLGPFCLPGAQSP